MNTEDLFVSPVLITLPGFVRGEAQAICALQRSGAGIIHLRKPGADPTCLTRLLDELREAGADFGRLTLHGDEALTRRYGFGGIHLKGEELLRCAALRENASGGQVPGVSGGGVPLRLSCSAHSWDEARRWAPAADYVWLSPLFDSISKAGYRSGIDIAGASRLLLDGRRTEGAGKSAPASGEAFPFSGRIVALGGISPENIARVRMAGFGGAAVLGALWAGAADEASGSAADGKAGRLSDARPLDTLDINKTLRNFGRLDRRWKAAGGTLQLISDGDMAVAEAFLAGGGRWIQLRMKEASPGQIVARGREMAALCSRYGALLLLNDHPELVAAAGARGVHLGKSDMPPAQARTMLGESAIIGCTANTLEDILALSTQPADYIGLGPFRYTTTKKNLSPLLGEAGYRLILSAMRRQGLCIPVAAIGGVGSEDVETVMRTGVNGLAISGSIARSADPRTTTRILVEAIARWRIGWEESVEVQSG